MSHRPLGRARPQYIDLAFALTLAPAVIDFLVQSAWSLLPPPWLGALNLLAVVGLWFVLRWDRRRPVVGVALAILFVLVALALGLTASAGMHLFVPLLGFANLSFVIGPRVTTLAVGGVVLLLSVTQWLVFDGEPGTVLGTGLLMTAGGGLAVALGATAARAEGERDEALALAARIRELTLAEERARMSREMHDSVGHHLTVATMSLGNASLLRGGDEEGAWTQIEGARSSVERALSETRLWVRALRPTSLDERGLVGALRALTSSSGGIDVRLDVEGPADELAAEAALTLYRAAQEGVANAVRHAGAKRVSVAVRVDGTATELLVVDDGVPAHEVVEGFGLSALRERAVALGGTMTLTPGSPDRPGTTLHVHVPSHDIDATGRAG